MDPAAANSRPLRVLMVSRRFPPEVVGGGELSALALARALREAGVDARVCTFLPGGDRHQDDTLDGVPVYRRPVTVWPGWPRLSSRELLYVEMARAAGPVVDDFQPDLLHALNLESIPSVAFVARSGRRPYVATINSPWMLCYTGDGVDSDGHTCVDCRPAKRWRCVIDEKLRAATTSGWRARLEAAASWLYSHGWYHLFRRSALGAGALFCISDGLRADLTRLGYPPSLLHTVHNPFEVPAASPPCARARLGLPDGAFVVGYLGRLSPAKGIDHLLASVAELAALPGDGARPAHALIVGRDEGAAVQLRRQVAELGLTSRVRFVDYLPQGELGPYYAACDAVVMAGAFYEGLGRMLLEAQARGIPVVARAVGGIPDVVKDGQTGYLLQGGALAPLTAALARLQSQPELARRLGEAGRAHIAAHFTATTAAARMFDVYWQLIDGAVPADARAEHAAGGGSDGSAGGYPSAGPAGTPLPDQISVISASSPWRRRSGSATLWTGTPDRV
jgi:glycosyltransferase involved in cell wall biosynthesis